MGMMNDLRENTGVILWILVFAFGVIWVLQDSGGLDAVGQVGNNIATVNGSPVTLEEYNQAIETQIQNYQQRTGESMPPQMLDQTRDRVFDQLVDLRLREQELERLGIGVSDEELVDMIQGDDPHPIIKTYFGDGEGGVDRTLLQNFISNPEATQDWLNIEDYLRNERRREKLDNLIANTVRVSEADVQAEHIRQNRTADVEFVALRYAALPDDSISYDEGDLRDFYNDHREEFARKKTFSLAYVTMSKDPTAADTAAIVADVQGLRDAFAAAESDSMFLARNGSQKPYTDAYFRPDELSEKIAEVVFEEAEVGDVVGPVIADDMVHLVKIKDVRAPEEPAVRASHILFRAAEGDSEARSQARQEANDVLREIRGGADFAAMARQHSDDGSASRGGDLGWFGPGRMVAPFEEAAFDAPVDRVVGPIETQFGYHLIKVVERATVEAQIADFALDLRASVSTLNSVQETLEDLQYFATEDGDFAGEAERRSMNVQTVSVEADQEFIPGLGFSRALLTFLETAEEGDVTEVIELNDRFIVAEVQDVTPEGYQPFEDVRAQIEPRLRNEMKADIQEERMSEAFEQTGFDGLADALNSTVRTASGLSYSNMVVPGIGRDPKFVGAALGMSSGDTSNILRGENAVYVIRVTAINDPAPLEPAEYSRIREQLERRRQQQVRSQWITSLRESADIDDNRRLFQQ